jgi:nicotinamidase-related amidase
MNMQRGGERDLHGQAPDKAARALLLVDVINDLEFEGGDALLEPALEVAARLAALKGDARAAGVPVLYVNDNFGRWQSDFSALVEHYLGAGVRGAPIIRRLLPSPDDYHVLKPKPSGFFATPLAVLLEHLEVSELVITGLTTDHCVMLTAVDAYMHGYSLTVPHDCTAAIRRRDHDAAIEYIGRVLKADVRSAAESASFARRETAAGKPPGESSQRKTPRGASRRETPGAR